VVTARLATPRRSAGPGRRRADPGAGSGNNGGMPVEFTADGVRDVLADGRPDELRWDELAEVRVITTADGPFAEDVIFVLVAADGVRRVTVPHAMATDAFIQRLQLLPGFDNQALIRSMYSVTEDQFLLWRAASADG